MATKSGLLRRKDFRNGLLAWVVRIEANSAGGFDIDPPTQVRILSPSFHWDTPEYRTSVVDFQYIDDDCKYCEKDGITSFSFCEFGIPSGGLDPERMYRHRLFRKKKQALKYLSNFNEKALALEIKEARQVDDFMAALGGDAQPTYPELENTPPKTFRNTKRFLRPPGQQLRRLAWAEDRAPTAYTACRDSDYNNAYHAHILTRPAGSRPFDAEDQPHETELVTAKHVVTLPGHVGRRRPTTCNRKFFKAEDRRQYREPGFYRKKKSNAPPSDFRNSPDGYNFSFDRATLKDKMEKYLADTARADAHDLAYNPHKNGAGLVGLHDPVTGETVKPEVKTVVLPSGTTVRLYTGPTPGDSSRLSDLIDKMTNGGKWEGDPVDIKYTGQMNEAVISEVGLVTATTFQRLCAFCKDKGIVMAPTRSLGGIDVPIELFMGLVEAEKEPNRFVTIQRGKRREAAVPAEGMQYYTAHFLPDAKSLGARVIDNMTTDPDTYKGLEDKGDVPTPPNEAS